jgi:hypothetical protein
MNSVTTIFLTTNLKTGRYFALEKKILTRRLDMVSRTRVTKTKRANKLKKQGLARKKKDRNKGSTPKFAVHQGAEKK